MKALDGLRRASFEIRYAIVSKLLDWSERVMKHREAVAFPPTDVNFFHGDAAPDREIVVSKPKFHHWRRYQGASIDGPYARPCLTEIAPGETKRCECGAMTLRRRILCYRCGEPSDTGTICDPCWALFGEMMAEADRREDA